MPNPQKVALFVCYDLSGLLTLNGLVPQMKKMGLEPVIFNTTDHRNRKFKVPTPAAVSFFNAGLLRDNVIPFLEGQSLMDAPNYTFRQLAQIHDLEYHEIEDVNSPELAAQIINDPDMIGGISERFLQIFGREIINVFREKGFIWNLHGGLLPDYKGLLTTYQAIANGEKEYGVTLHDMTREIDAGGMIAHASLPLDISKPVLDLYLDLVPDSIKLIMENLAHFQENGFVPSIAQPPSNDDYYTNPTTQEFRKAAQNGTIYADTISLPDTLTGLFSLPETQHGALFKRVPEIL